MTRRALLQSAALVPLGRLHASAPDWLSTTYRQLHIDAHFGQLPNPYKTFNADRAAQIIADAGFQLVSIFAICNSGYCYFPSKLGVTHPGLKRDFTGEFIAALKGRGTRVLAYVSVGPDRRYFKDHPDCVTSTRGEMAQVCVNSPWLEEAHIPQLREIASLYDVDGFFLDSLVGKFLRGGCTCKYCIDPATPAVEYNQWLARSAARYADRITTALKPGLAFALNHIWVSRNPVAPPPSITQLVWEPVPPYTGVHALDFSFEARYLSTQRGVSNWSCMATRGNGWGDFSLRDTTDFQLEAAVALAGGGRPYFGDDSYPSGNPDPAVYRTYGEVNRRTAALEPYLRGCTPIADVAVLHSALSLWSNSAAAIAISGAHTALAEEHVVFSILNSSTLPTALGSYRVLVLPEQSILTDAEIDAIRRFVQSGGVLIATGDTVSSGALTDVLGIRYVSRAEVRRSFLRSAGMDTQSNGPYIRVELTTAKTHMPLVPPAGPKQVPAEQPEGPGITRNQFGRGVAIYSAQPLFTAYQQDGTLAIRNLTASLLRDYPRSIALDNAPASVEMTYQSRGRERFVHLVNFGGGRRMNAPQRVRNFAAVYGIQVRVRCAAPPRKVSLVPEQQPVSFEWRDGWVAFAARPLQIHSVYMLETL